MTTGPESLAVVVGRNCRRIRTTAGITQNELAKHARDVGLRWTASKVGDFESGRNNPSFATVLALAATALSIATGTDADPRTWSLPTASSPSPTPSTRTARC